jgi:hypothetical protein
MDIGAAVQPESFADQEHGHSICVTANANMRRNLLAPEISPCAKSTTVTWLAIRPGYPSRPGWQETHNNGSLFIPSTRIDGVAVLVFGIGTAGTLWVDKLALSGWFSGLAPDEADLRAAKMTARSGTWTLQDATGVAGLDNLVATAGLLGVPLATVAIGADLTSSDEICAVALVHALRARRWQGRCRTAVMVTLDLSSLSVTRRRLAKELRDAGAFVVEPAGTARGMHLHHFPLRAAIMPRAGWRLVCTDLADHLACWPARSWGRLYRLDETPLLHLPVPRAAVRAHILHWHANLEQADLGYLDHQNSRCRERWTNAETVFTTVETMDGSVGSFDLLLVH